jgi:hypothetical protein
MTRVRRLKKMLLVLLVGLVAVTLTSCSAMDKGYSTDEMSAEYGYDSDYYDGAPAEAEEDSYNKELSSRSGAVSAAEIRYVILNGSMDLTVSDTRKTVGQVRDAAAAAGGIISDSYIYEFREGHYAAYLTLRVPAERFDSVMDQLEKMGKADNVRKGDEDVTMQYLDLEARITNLEAQEERFREILEMADTVEEVMIVERELGRVRGDIEAMTAHFNQMRDQVTYSTINLTINEEIITTQTISQAPFDNLGQRMKEAFVRSINLVLSGVAGLLILLTAILPVLIVLGLVAAILWLIIARATRRRKPPAA